MKALLKIMLVAGCLFGVMGCDKERDDTYYNNDSYYYNGDYPRYVTVDVRNKTGYQVDVYYEDGGYITSIEPVSECTFPDELYPGEKLKLKFLVYNQYPPSVVVARFSDDLQNYHLNIYNSYYEKY